MIKEVLEEALREEMKAYLAEPSDGYNKRNGVSRKQVKGVDGSFTLETPRDRNSDFSPQIVAKRETILAETLQSKILGLYGLGMSYRDISDHISEMYGTKVSPAIIQQVTDRLIPMIKAWQNRLLDAIYPIIWLDAMHVKVRDEGVVKTKALYCILALNKEGKKEILCIHLGESEGAKLWLEVLTNLQSRGVKDILIACTDNLKGFSEAINSIFPKTEVQTCVIHQVRNSIKYVASKNKKEFVADLKMIYKAPTKAIAEENLDILDQKWGKVYPIVIKSWRDNWEKLTSYFSYAEGIRKMIYTTNAIEGYHRQLRRVTKTKGAFSSDMALLKLVFSANKRIHQKWTQPINNWGLIAQQLFIKFGERMPMDLM